MLCYVFISCSHLYSLRGIETGSLNVKPSRGEPGRDSAVYAFVYMCVSEDVAVCKHELAGKVELAGFGAVLGFLPVSKHLAEVGTRCPSRTHTHTQLYAL